MGHFLAAAGPVLDRIEERGHRALLVGGTGLYYQALVDGLEVPGTDPRRCAPTAQARVVEEGLSVLFSELAERDPLAASRIDTRQPAPDRPGARGDPGHRPAVLVLRPGGFEAGPGRGLDVVAAGVWLPRAVTARRIETRFAAMEEAGLVAEVRRLVAAPEGLSRTARQAIGYKEVLDHLEGGGPTLEDGLRRAVERTRGLARRQRCGSGATPASPGSAPSPTRWPCCRRCWPCGPDCGC